jgi:hypothetical protein
MTPKPQLHERLSALYGKYQDPELARCALLAVEIRDEMRKTRWDRFREWTLLVMVSAYILRGIVVWAAQWL